MQLSAPHTANGGSIYGRLADALEASWRFRARPEQLMPGGDWFVWLIMAGRGWGKTRTAVECIAEMLRGPSPLVAPPGAPAVMSLIADSPFDMRQYTIEGPSGFENVGPAEYRPHHEPSKKTLTWPNGCRALLFSAEDPETLRGASGSFFWWDELAKSRYAQAGWDNMMFGMREGNPRGIVTTTPRPIPLLKQLIKRPSTHITRGSTWDNKANLSEVYYREVIEPKIGTRLGRQEIEAELLEDTPGALWQRKWIDDGRVEKAPDLQRIVVAIDPAVTNNEGSDETGVVVAGCDGYGEDRRYYVLDDISGRYGPLEWAQKAINAYHRHRADRIVAEVNNGGLMVEATIKTVDPKAPYQEVRASRGKVVRAEPISALYEQGKVSHVGSFTALEDQMCSFSSDFNRSTAGYSPDRLDALVWALTELSEGGSTFTLDNIGDGFGLFAPPWARGVY